MQRYSMDASHLELLQALNAQRRQVLIMYLDSRRRVRNLLMTLTSLITQLCDLLFQSHVSEAAMSEALTRRTFELYGMLSAGDCDLPEEDDIEDTNKDGLLWERLQTVDRRFWVQEKSVDWWERIVLQTWGDQQWRENFRMTKATFLEICAELTPELRRQTTNMRVPLSVEKRVAIAIWKLATPNCQRSVANQFGVGKSTAGSAIREVCTAIRKVLAPRFLGLFNPQEVINGFAHMGFPNCIGVINSIHIPILCPPHRSSEYMNRKGFFSIGLQGLVDHCGRFTHITAGWSGKMHDARVFRNSSLVPLMRRGDFAGDASSIEINGVTIPPLIIGNPAYPLLPWLMKPFIGYLDPRKELFNHRLSNCWLMVEHAFGRLRARWRALNVRLDASERYLSSMVVACCILHNICETRGETLGVGWVMEAERLSQRYEQPEPVLLENYSQQGTLVREALADYFEQEEGAQE
ncbi:protein ANTAGONIST OF LIKE HETEROCHROMATIN PROTEIN 1-like [Alligator sinensis]|uniref:Protein ANTAGONIST OF LIKE HETEROCHROMATIN PROTEIN 1-like n=1 Tax=Alligator sinensis TaxID=38654 RepID=A0A3Q0GQY7_ALLSI|nr:protein ANTAGONIST OF LIKE HETEROCHROMATIN PROTEIN 1-like [Alligator sinensis]XP_025060607.1 protein ANTAGONIST OF LIKE HETEROCHROMATIN PROTEIN 1-like [Alligator sinensis]XP_025060608.1 protein ANTAGONIST OF LIKE HETEROCHROMATIN PROTEIN 1-like [Alligator sinensis]XP_025060609.1 protein ANTAGONIST OF LIKE HETEROCHROMATIN PROTEIN 1-like [Alligator sinensis]